MKINVYLLSITILLFLTSSFILGEKDTRHPQKNFSVIVTVDSSLCTPAQYIYLYYLQYNECYIEDSSLVSLKKNQVCLQGYVPYQESVSLLFEKQGPGEVELIASPGDTISIRIDKEDVKNLVCKEVTGSSATNEEAAYFNHRDTLLQRRFSLLEKMSVYHTDSALQSIRGQIETIEEELRRKQIQSLKSTSQPYIAWLRATLLSPNDFGADSVKKLRAETFSRFPTYEKMERLKPDRKKRLGGSHESLEAQQRLHQIRARKRELKSQLKTMGLISKDAAKEEVQVEGRYALWNVEVSDTNNKVLILPLSTGKYILVNFWATWCIPCLHEMHFIHQLQERYGNKLLIYNISLDKDKDKWQNAIQSLGLGGVYNFSGVNSSGEFYPTVERLNIKTIPANYLLSPNGEILYVDISKKQLIHVLDSI